jgi:hypothetical protein
MEEPIYCVINAFNMEPVISKTYTVTWDGVSYDAVAREADGLACIGNENYAKMTSGGDIPFAIIFAGNNIFVSTESTATSHTISVSTTETVIHTLDSKYLDLPTNLATTDDVQSALAVANEAYQIADNVNGNLHTVETNLAAETTAREEADAAKMNATNPVGTGSFSIGRMNDSAIGTYSSALGYDVVANSKLMHATGRYNIYDDAPYVIVCYGLAIMHASTGCYYADEYTFDETTGEFSLVNPTRYSKVSQVIDKWTINRTSVDSTSRTLWRIVSNNTSEEYQGVQSNYAEGKYVHVVGNGTSDTARSNAHTLDWNGNAWYQGTVEGTAMIVKSSTSGSTKRFKITVDDSGTIKATQISG